MNILLTSLCNRRCRYCFAAERIGDRLNGGSDSPGDEAGESDFFLGGSLKRADKPHGAKNIASTPKYISADDFKYALRFASRSNQKTVGILGGEPSLHPQFIELLEFAWKEGICTKIFTNGLWSADLIKAFKTKIPDSPRLLHMVVNVNSPHDTPEDEQERQFYFLNELGRWCALSYNIYRADFDGCFLVDLAIRYGTRKEIRLAIAQPLAGMDNAHVDLEDYPKAAPAVIELARKGDEREIGVSFDCGFVMCMFTASQLGELMMHGVRFAIRCAAVIDVGTDLSVWACFPLSTIVRGVRLKDFDDLSSLNVHFKEVLGRLYKTGAMDICIDCIHRRRNRCTGGCAAHVFRRLNPRRDGKGV